ncbi:MAG: pilin [Candidatus Moranbacteria bacterium]|nr:pilin [Candidatus Moranbacteria bacterium]
MVKINKKIKHTSFPAIVFWLFYGAYAPAQAQTLSRIPGQESTADDLIEYLNNFYKFGLSSIAILAVFMIAVGAFTYLVLAVGNPSKMQSAKEKITNALFGLALAFLAYLMLFVINPDLVSGTIAGLSEKTQEIQNNTKGNYWNNSSASQKNNQSSNKAQCGDADGESFENKPSQDLCSQGEPTNVKEETNAWTWTCQAPEEGGEDASCYAAKEDVPQNGRCGSADQKTLIKEPEKSDLCDRGTPSQVQEESGQWTWDCQGINEGEDRSCSAEKREEESNPSDPQDTFEDLDIGKEEICERFDNIDTYSGLRSVNFTIRHDDSEYRNDHEINVLIPPAISENNRHSFAYNIKAPMRIDPPGKILFAGRLGQQPKYYKVDEYFNYNNNPDAPIKDAGIMENDTLISVKNGNPNRLVDFKAGEADGRPLYTRLNTNEVGSAFAVTINMPLKEQETQEWCSN